MRMETQKNLANDTKTGFQYRLIEASKKPWQHSFYTLLRHLSASYTDNPPLGEATKPQQDAIRLGQIPSLIFAPREIASVEAKTIPAKVKFFSLGMLGPHGALPIHFTEIAKDRLENRKDATLVDFLDTFHHRFFTHFYRAWAQAQATAGLDRADDERFSRYIAWLSGDDPNEIMQSALPSHARLAASTHLIREARNVEGLEKTLAHFFKVPIRIEENILDWMSINAEDITALGKASIASVMGQGAILGEKVPDRQSKFRIVIGPLNLAQYLRFTPNGQDLSVLVEWVRAFIGFEYVWDVELKVASETAPAVVLGDQQQLGWSTWLGSGRPTSNISGMIFEPEYYFNYASTVAA